MGSTWSAKVVPGPQALNGATLDALHRAIEDDLNRVNALLSTWDPESELSRFNRSTRLEPFAVAPETFEAFRWAETIAGETGGAFDITVGPLLDAWGFGARDVPDARPDDESIVRLRELTGMHLLELDAGGRWVRKRRAGVQCDMSALVPGYAADRIAAILAEGGLLGLPRGREWRARRPRAQRERRAVASGN
jgi:thiamine biosynthesis lipoprotein